MWQYGQDRTAARATGLYLLLKSIHPGLYSGEAFIRGNTVIYPNCEGWEGAQYAPPPLGPRPRATLQWSSASTPPKPRENSVEYRKGTWHERKHRKSNANRDVARIGNNIHAHKGPALGCQSNVVSTGVRGKHPSRYRSVGHHVDIK